MGGLEDEVRQELYLAALSRPQALEAIATGETVLGDLGSLIRDVMLPLLLAQGDLIIRLAAEIDELKARTDDAREPR